MTQPQSRPAAATTRLSAVAMLQVLEVWNSYLWPLTVMQGNSDNYPIVISLSRLLSYNRSAVNTGLVMAGATLAVLPPLILFVFLQRFFVRTITASGVTAQEERAAGGSPTSSSSQGAASEAPSTEV